MARHAADAVAIFEVAWGPRPAEARARVRSLPWQIFFIRGNTDRELAASHSRTPWVASACSFIDTHHGRVAVPGRLFVTNAGGATWRALDQPVLRG